MFFPKFSGILCVTPSQQEASNPTSTILVFFLTACLPFIWAAFLIYCISFLLSYFGIIQSIQSFCIYWEISNIQKGHFHVFVAEREGNHCVYIIRLFLKNGLWFQILLILDFKKKWNSHKHWCPFQTISLLIIHSRIFKQIFLKHFF